MIPPVPRAAAGAGALPPTSPTHRSRGARTMRLGQRCHCSIWSRMHRARALQHPARRPTATPARAPCGSTSAATAAGQRAPCGSASAATAAGQRAPCGSGSWATAASGPGCTGLAPCSIWLSSIVNHTPKNTAAAYTPPLPRHDPTARPLTYKVAHPFRRYTRL